MRFSQETAGLPVIHAASGREVGKLKEWLLDEDGATVVAFITEGSGWLPHRRVFSYRDVLGMGPDAVLVSREGNHLEGDPPQIEGHPTRRFIGRRVLSDSGAELGLVEDILIEEETGRVAGWRLSSGLVDDILEGRQVMDPPAEMSFGEDVLIIRN